MHRPRFDAHNKPTAPSPVALRAKSRFGAYKISVCYVEFSVRVGSRRIDGAGYRDLAEPVRGGRVRPRRQAKTLTKAGHRPINREASEGNTSQYL